jgi:protein-tyrosine-phosphatase
MAQVLLERMLARHGADAAIRVRSGGIANYARDGMIASLDARLALRDEGIHLAENDFVSTDLRRHRDLLAGADLILTMTVLHCRDEIKRCLEKSVPRLLVLLSGA